MLLVFPLSLLASDFASAADDSKVKVGIEQVESGAKKIPSSKIGEGVFTLGCAASRLIIV